MPSSAWRMTLAMPRALEPEKFGKSTSPITSGWSGAAYRGWRRSMIVFPEELRDLIFGLFRRGAAVSNDGVKTQSFADYIYSLYVPTSLNVIRVSPSGVLASWRSIPAWFPSCRLLLRRQRHFVFQGRGGFHRDGATPHPSDRGAHLLLNEGMLGSRNRAGCGVLPP